MDKKTRKMIVFPIKQSEMDKDIEKIFDSWCDLRKSLGKRKPEITKKRKRILKEVLKDFTVEDCLLVVRYIKESSCDYAKFMRESKSGKYTLLVTIFRTTIFEDKLERAKDWEFELNKVKAQEMHVPFKVIYGGKT